ncbi:hypothetical protein HDU91_003893 [Kappamyces sp. JEL0680]|nr:hypothetical protein HDU91_003893 [Kappamyces sp. JEL0680]
MSTYRKAAPRRTHKERAQPVSREKFGLLEKKKDYVLRARDYHRKEDALKLLRQKAAFRNPDEFYFGMINSKTVKGEHVVARKAGFDNESLALMKSQDASYVQLQQSINKKKIEKLKDSIHIVETKGAAKPNHILFVENEEKVAEFDAATHFDTTPELVHRKSNRTKRHAVEAAEFEPLDKGTLEANDADASEQIKIVDIRMRTQDIPRQVVLTKDNVSIKIDSVLYWEVDNPYTAIYLVADVQKALIDRTQTTLRMVLGNKTLQDTIEHRVQIAQEIRDVIDETAESWGVKVESILIKDVILGEDILANISAAASQKRIGESKVIAAQAEVNSAKLMREAADILNSPAAMQIRYLETLQAMAAKAGTKVIFMPTGPGGLGADMTMKDAAILEDLSSAKN